MFSNFEGGKMTSETDKILIHSFLQEGSKSGESLLIRLRSKSGFCCYSLNTICRMKVPNEELNILSIITYGLKCVKYKARSFK